MVDLAMAIRARCWALVFVGVYSGLRMGELAGIRQSRVDRWPRRSPWPRPTEVKAS
jgi:integrase